MKPPSSSKKEKEAPVPPKTEKKRNISGEQSPVVDS
jgi:hypothetical protein